MLQTERDLAALPADLARKVLDRAAARRLRDEMRGRGERLVLTNGVFDLIHAGHVRYLLAARALGDALVVGLNDDASVRRYKGAERPIQPLADRAELLAALVMVDAVVPFGEDTAEALVAELRPDVYVKGGDYALGLEEPGDGTRGKPPGTSGKPLPEAGIVEGYGGEVHLIPYRPGRSTTALIERIRAAAPR